MNRLMMPALLQFAVKIAAHTEQIKIITAITILPIRDMRVFAGEVVADIFTEGRLLLGVGRGNFSYEMERLGILTARHGSGSTSPRRAAGALTREEVSWDGNYYKLDPITIMPRPMNPGGPQMMMAAVNPEAIYHSARADIMFRQHQWSEASRLSVNRSNPSIAARRNVGKPARTYPDPASVSYMCHSEMEKRERIQMAHAFMGRFENVMAVRAWSTTDGSRAALPAAHRPAGKGPADTAKQEMIDKLAAYDEMGVDRIIMNVNFGCDPHETMDSIQYFAEEVMPHFAKTGPTSSRPDTSAFLQNDRAALTDANTHRAQS